MQDTQYFARLSLSRALEEVEPIDVDERFREYLDEAYQPAKIGRLEFHPSRVLEELDKPGFRAMQNDFIFNQKEWVPFGAYYYSRSDAKDAWQNLIDKIESYGREFTALKHVVERQVAIILGE